MKKIYMNTQVLALIAKIVGIGEKLPSMLSLDDTGLASIHMEEFLEYGAAAWRSGMDNTTLQQIKRMRCGIDDLFLEKFVRFGYLLERHLNTEQLQKAIKKPQDFLQYAAWAWRERPTPIKQIDAWSQFYNTVLGYTGVEFKPEILPDEHPGFTQLVVFHEGLTINRVIKALRELCGNDLFYEDELQSVSDFITDSDKIPDYNYAVLVRRSAGPDKQYLEKSAAEIRDKNIVSQSLLGRLLLHAFYFWEHGKHLDETSVTICAGNHFLKGDVPIVYMFGKRLKIGRCSSLSGYPISGIREVRIASK